MDLVSEEIFELAFSSTEINDINGTLFVYGRHCLLRRRICLYCC